MSKAWSPWIKKLLDANPCPVGMSERAWVMNLFDKGVPENKDEFPIHFAPVEEIQDELRLVERTKEYKKICEEARMANARRMMIKKREQGSFVYFALCKGFCKIGHSVTPKNRVANMNSGCPFDIKLIVAIRGAREKEKEMHGRFDALRTRGEWFRYEGELREFVEGLIK